MNQDFQPQDAAPSVTAPTVATPLPRRHAPLQSRNVRIHERRTSVRLEPEMWNALNEVAAAERCSIHDLCGAVHDLKEPGVSFTAALRVFLMEYYRAAAKADTRIGQVQQRLRPEGGVAP